MFSISKEKNKKNIIKYAVLIVFSTLVFKGLGFVKQAVVAFYYGAALETDIFYSAYNLIIDSSRSIIKNFGIALIVVYSSVKGNKEKKELDKLVSIIFKILIVFSVILSLSFFIFSKQIASIISINLASTNLELLSNTISILSFVYLFLAFQLIGSSILNAEKDYFYPRLESAIISICAILSCLILKKYLNIGALIVSTYLSTLIFSFILWRKSSRYIKISLLKIEFTDDVLKVIKLALPLVIGDLFMQLIITMNRNIGFSIGEGAVSALNYANTLVDFVKTVFITSLSEMLLSYFSNLRSSNNEQKLLSNTIKAINIILCVLIPISIISYFNSENIVRIVYFRGAFDEKGVSLTSSALSGYMLCFPALAVINTISNNLFANQQTKKPMIFQVLVYGIMIFPTYLLAKEFGTFGIALGYSIATYVYLIFILVLFRKRNKEFRIKDTMTIVLKYVIAIIPIMIMVKLIVGLNIDGIIEFGLSSIVGFVVFEIEMYLLGEKDLFNIVNKYLKLN